VLPLCGALSPVEACAPVAQLDRAPDYESGGQRFESFRARHFPKTTVGTGQRSGRWPEIADEGSLNSSLKRNIEALRRRRVEQESRAALDERLARTIARFAGSMRFVLVHALLYGSWILANLGAIPGLTPWDPTFVSLAMIASVEAIFLSTFILINQNRMAAAEDRRAELDLQISLLAEAEITKLVELVSEIAERMHVPANGQGEIEEMKHRVAPEAVLDAIEQGETEKGEV
jgi:uncharacterized membrane protein